MGKKFFVSTVLALSLSLTGCASWDTTDAIIPTATPTVDESLVPTAAPSDVIDVEPGKYLTSYGDVIFKVGDGPTWCTISEFDDFVICEHKEFSAKYQSIPVPEDCEFSYGYQARLLGNAVAGSKMAEFTCANAAWSDASGAPILASGERITIYGFSCFVAGQVARCENQAGDYLVLGPEVWAFSD